MDYIREDDETDRIIDSWRKRVSYMTQAEIDAIVRNIDKDIKEDANNAQRVQPEESYPAA